MGVGSQHSRLFDPPTRQHGSRQRLKRTVEAARPSPVADLIYAAGRHQARVQWVCQLSVVSGKNAGAATVVNLLRIGLSCRGACRLPLARPYTRGNCKSSQQPREWNRYEGRLHSHGSVVKIVQGRARCQVSHNETSSRERWRHRRPYRSQQTLQATGTKPAHPTGMVSPCPSSGPLAFDTRVRVGSGSLDSESRPHFLNLDCTSVLCSWVEVERLTTFRKPGIARAVSSERITARYRCVITYGSHWYRVTTVGVRCNGCVLGSCCCDCRRTLQQRCDGPADTTDRAPQQPTQS